MANKDTYQLVTELVWRSLFYLLGTGRKLDHYPQAKPIFGKVSGVLSRYSSICPWTGNHR